MRVATFNIHHGEGIDGRYDLDRIADMIASFEADLVALQELDDGWDRSARHDQPALLQEALGMEVLFHPTVVRSDGARYGIALASRGPIAGSEIVALPRGAENESRAALAVRTGTVTFIATHLTRDRVSRPRQMEVIAGLVRRTSGPVIVAGDMNSNRRGLGPLFAAGLTTHPGTVRTMPARLPRGQIDHILAGEGARVAAAWSVRTRASDHRPLIAEISLDI